MRGIDWLQYLGLQLQSQFSVSYSLLRQLCHTNILQATISIQQLNQSKLKGDYYLDHPLHNFEKLNFLIERVLNSKQRSSSKIRFLFELLAILLFNISAINQQHIAEIESNLLDSTSIENPKQMAKDKAGIQHLKQQLKEWITQVLSLSAIKRMIDLVVKSDEKNFNQVPQANIFFQTIDYICVKYRIHIESSPILEYISNQPAICEPKKQVVQFVNHYLFGDNVEPLIQLLNQNYNINESNLLKIIDANYVNTSRPRTLFRNTAQNGKQMLQNLVTYMVSKEGVDRNQMFNQKYYDQHRSFRFFIKLLWDRYAHIALKFTDFYIKDAMTFSLNISSSFQTMPNRSKILTKNQFIDQNAKTLKQISSFFTFVIIQDCQFQAIMHFMHNKLSKKFGKSASIQIIKKVILNRFLLNPQMQAKYHQWNDQQRLRAFAQAANAIRILFYEKRVKEQSISPGMSKVSIDIRDALCRFLQSEPNFNGFQGRSKLAGTVYIPDKILYLSYQRVISDINWSNQDNSYSISFSLHRNQETSKNYSSNSRNNVESKSIRHRKLEQKNINKDLKSVSANSSHVQINNPSFAFNNIQTFNPKQEYSIRALIEQIQDTPKNSKYVAKSERKINYIYKSKQQKLQQPPLPLQSFKKARKQVQRQVSQKHSPQQHASDSSNNKNQTQLQTQLTMNNLNEDEKFEQLLFLRRNYGEKKRMTKIKFDDKNKKWKAKSGWFKSINQDMLKLRKQLQRSKATVQIDIDIL